MRKILDTTLHGTLSTLAENVEAIRGDVELLSFDMLWQMSLALDQYTATSAPDDKAGALLTWIAVKRQEQVGRTTP